MAFIHTIPPSEAEGAVREMYERAQKQVGYVPNWAQAFSLRPGVMAGWTALLSSIRTNLSTRMYELATLAAARALRSSYCALAHGNVLATSVFDPKTVTVIAEDAEVTAPLEPRERAVMRFAEKVVRSATEVTRADVDGLRAHGLRDEEIFDVAAAAAARCFFSTLLDALGAEPDSRFHELDPALRRALTVGRAVGTEPIATLPDRDGSKGGTVA